MASRHSVRLLAIVAACLPLCGCAGEPPTCDELAVRFNDAPTTTIDARIALVGQLDAQGCGEFASLAKRDVALRLGAKLAQLPAEDSAERLALAERVLGFDPNHTGALLVRAQIHIKSKRWAEAARDSESAMFALIDLDRKMPGNAETAQSLELAYNLNADARSLAANFLAREQRRGEQLCEFARTRSGVAYAVLAEPIEFEFDKATFTQKGQLAADAIAAHMFNGCVKRDAVLLGHTDPAGTAAYNCALAETRLRAVQQHIQAYFEARPMNGKMPSLTLVPQGEGRPRGQFPEGLSREDRFQLLRRVEFRDASAGNPPACDTNRENETDYGR